MADPFIGEIKMVGFDYAPIGYASCDGQLISIVQNTALFSLLANRYGGDGRTNFALPDLRGRAPVHRSFKLRQGDRVGSETVPLAVAALGDPGGTEEVAAAGETLPSNMMPYCVLNFVIALQGAFPQRD